MQMNKLQKKYRFTKLACYFTGFSMSAAANLSAILFIIFNELYGITFTQLGFLVLVNYCTQLGIDLVFTFLSDKFNIPKTVKSIPLLVVAGLVVYSVVPMLYPEATYIAFVAGTVIFSVGAGLGEVLTSPVIAAIPSQNPEREMSKLHSAYAWGTVVVVILTTVILKLIGNDKWMYLALFWSVIPLVCFILFAMAEIPELDIHGEESGEKKRKVDLGIILCTACIFFGGAAECTMMQWVSGFAEEALGIPKVYGDIFGMALFALTLGVGRTLYSKRGRNIFRVLLAGMGASAACYIVASVSDNAFIGLMACVVTGFCTSMLWPGTITYTSEKYISCSVGVYALLAAGGDLGASVSPQLMGIIADTFGMKTGMLVASVFPLSGFILFLFTERYFRKKLRQR